MLVLLWFFGYALGVLTVLWLIALGKVKVDDRNH